MIRAAARSLRGLVHRQSEDRLPLGLQARTAARAASLLVRRLGLRQGAAVLAEVARAQQRGEPFAHLDPPPDARESLSRQQAGPAILLVRALRRRRPSEQALDIAREVVVAGAVLFLAHTIGPIHRESLLALSRDEQEAWVKDVGAQFFNATMRWEEIGPEHVRFTVTHCRFPELCAAAGAPEVAPLLCQGDAVYFGEVLESVRLERPHTLAEGGADCPFTLRWRQT